MSCETTLKTPVSNRLPGLTRDMLQCFARLCKHWPDRRLTLVWLEDNVVFNVPEVVLQRPVAASRRSPAAVVTSLPQRQLGDPQTASHQRRVVYNSLGSASFMYAHTSAAAAKLAPSALWLTPPAAVRMAASKCCWLQHGR